MNYTVIIIITILVTMSMFLGTKLIPFEIADYNLYGIGALVGYFLGLANAAIIELDKAKKGDD